MEIVQRGRVVLQPVWKHNYKGHRLMSHPEDSGDQLSPLSQSTSLEHRSTVSLICSSQKAGSATSPPPQTSDPLFQCLLGEKP